TATALGISPRYVNDLLSDERTSFQRYVLTERLAHCQRDLLSPLLAHRHVGEIAFAWALTISRISGARFASITACRRAIGGTASTRSAPKANGPSAQIRPPLPDMPNRLVYVNTTSGFPCPSHPAQAA